MRRPGTSRAARSHRHGRAIALAALTCAVALAACGSSGSTSDGTGPTAQSQKVGRSISPSACVRTGCRTSLTRWSEATASRSSAPARGSTRKRRRSSPPRRRVSTCCRAAVRARGPRRRGRTLSCSGSRSACGGTASRASPTRSADRRPPRWPATARSSATAGTFSPSRGRSTCRRRRSSRRRPRAALGRGVVRLRPCVRRVIRRRRSTGA